MIPKKIYTDYELESLIAKRNLQKAKNDLHLYIMEKRINKIILDKALEDAKGKLKQLMDDPSKSLFKYGVGGYIEEQQRKNKLIEGMSFIEKKTKEIIKDG